MPSAAIHYFSGTGNTHRAMKIMEGKLRNAGYSVDMYRVSGSLRPPSEKYDIHVFGYPVYALDMPAIMLRYMKGLPRASARAAVIAIYGDLKLEHPLNGDEGYAVGHAARILRGKGYEVSFSDAVGYPVSITMGISPPEPADQEAIRSRSDNRIVAMADSILNNRHNLRHGSPLNPAWAVLGAMFMSLGRRAIGKLYVADRKCNGCGVCKKSCPAGTIKLVNRIPRWGFDCEACQRCINSCPQKAIQTSIVRILAVVALQVLSIATLIGLLFIPYGGLFGDLAVGPITAAGAIYGPAVALIAWAAISVLLSMYLVDELIWLGERTWLLQWLFHANLTQGFRRYLDPGFNPLEANVRSGAGRK